MTDVARFFQSYTHPKLHNVTGEVRRQFTQAITNYCLLSESASETSHYLNDVLPLAAIIGTDYSLDIDPAVLGDEVSGDNYRDLSGSMDDTHLPVPYHRFGELWPETANLPKLDLLARQVFLRIIKYVQLGFGMADLERVTPLRDASVERAIESLCTAGLVSSKHDVADLLTTLTMTELRKFANERGLPSRSTKTNLSRLIVQEIEEKEIWAYLQSKGVKENWLRPVVSNLPIFKKYVWAEINRLKLYITWIERVEYLHISPPRYSEEQKSDFERQRHSPDRMAPNAIDVSVFTTPGVMNPNVYKLIQGIWDDQCDEIVKRLSQDHGWYSPRYIGLAILDYLTPDVRAAFERNCWNIYGHPYWALTYFSIQRIKDLGVTLREPQLLKCAGCSNAFMEWSLSEGIYQRVGGKLHFCSICYPVACWHAEGATVKSQPQTEMLQNLERLATVLEAIPTLTFMKNPRLDQLSDDKQVAVVRALLRMPSCKEYEAQFGSWLKALISARVLEDGTQQMARGIRCIANDGHECLSLSEKTIDDWLSLNHIAHEKEPLYPHDPQLNSLGRLRADWKVGSTLIEYAGMLSVPEYAEKLDNKRDLARKHQIDIIILKPENVLSLDFELSRLR